MDAPGGSALARMIEAWPEIAAIVLIVGGVLLARVARYLAQRAFAVVNRSVARVGVGRGDLLSERVIRLLGDVAFWLVLAVAVLLALRTLGMGRVFTWIDVPLSYLPQLFVGFVIIGVGHLLGVVARNLVVRLQGSRGDTRLTPRIVQLGIFLIGAMTGLQHMGLDVSFIAELLILVVGVCLAGLSLAFALGARQYVANLVAGSAVARFAPGDRIVIDGIEGTIIELHRAGVDLATADGVVTVPAAMFTDHIVLRRDESGAMPPDESGSEPGGASASGAKRES